MKEAIHSTSRRNYVLILVALSLLVSACGAEPTRAPTGLQPTETAEPIDTPVSPTDTPMPTPVPRFEEAACPIDLPPGQEEGATVECGYLVVPEDRANPQSREIRLAVAVFHPPNGATKPDPIIYISGGPGVSELEFIWMTFGLQFAPLQATGRDLVVFDQRGIGHSEPALDCPDLHQLGLELLDGEMEGQAVSEQEEYSLGMEATLACADALREDVDLAAYHTAASAADVNDLRLALGYEQVNLWGGSYGTRLALEVMRDYPAGVRSVVLDSVYPLDVDIYVEGPANAARAFEVLFEDCDADADCSATYPDLRTVLFDTIDRLDEEPAILQVTEPFSGSKYDVRMNGDDLAKLIFGFLKSSSLLPTVPRTIYQAAQDQFDPLARLFGALLEMEEAASAGMFYSVQCHDEYVFTSPAEFETALADHSDWSMLFEETGLGRFGLEVCASWGAGQAEPEENQAVTSDIPALILAGEYDPTTPPAWGQRAGETLENAYFFEFPGVSHGVSGVAGCPQEMMVAFLNDPDTAPDDDCLASMDSPQFVPPAEVEDIELEPFVDEDMNITGLVPAGWTELGFGTYTRGTSDLDAVVVAVQAGPLTAEVLLGLYVQQLGLGETPESVGERQANGLVWSLYAFDVQGLPVDLALAEGDGMAMVVLLQSPLGSREALLEELYLPIIDALVPLGQEALIVANAFMQALVDTDYGGAYDLCAPELQAEFGSAEDLGAWLVTNGIEPQDWSFTDRNLNDDMVQLLGTGIFADDQEAGIEVILGEIEGEWFVTGFQVG